MTAAVGGKTPQPQAPAPETAETDTPRPAPRDLFEAASAELTTPPTAANPLSSADSTPAASAEPPSQATASASSEPPLHADAALTAASASPPSHADSTLTAAPARPPSHAEWFAARRAAAAASEAADAGTRSTTGLSPHAASVLCYAAAWLSALIVLSLERDSRLVRFHALQATLALGGLCLLAAVCGALTVVSAFYSTAAFQFFAVASEVAWAATIVIWLIALVCVARNASWRMPLVARLAERRL